MRNFAAIFRVDTVYSRLVALSAGKATTMMKLLFPGLMIAPVFALAFVAGNTSPFESKVTKTPATAVLASASVTTPDAAECRSETLGVVFRRGLLESHSAERLGEAFAPSPDCAVSFVRLTSLVPDTGDTISDEVAAAGVAKERRELATHIAALVGKDRADTLRVYSDVETTRHASADRVHALVRIERRPASFSSVAEAPANGALSELLN